MLQTRLKHLNNAIYKLKRSHGLPAVLHKIESHTVDPITGDKTTVIGGIKINKLIVLRAREFRSFIYDLAYISANKDFTTGGFFDPEDRQAYADARDLKGYEPQVGDYFVFNNSRFTIVEIQNFEDNSAFGFLLRKLRGADTVRIEFAHSGLILTHNSSTDSKGLLDRQVISVLNLTQNLKEVP